LDAGIGGTTKTNYASDNEFYKFYLTLAKIGKRVWFDTVMDTWNRELFSRQWEKKGKGKDVESNGGVVEDDATFIQCPLNEIDLEDSDSEDMGTQASQTGTNPSHPIVPPIQTAHLPPFGNPHTAYQSLADDFDDIYATPAPRHHSPQPIAIQHMADLRSTHLPGIRNTGPRPVAMAGIAMNQAGALDHNTTDSAVLTLSEPLALSPPVNLHSHSPSSADNSIHPEIPPPVAVKAKTGQRQGGKNTRTNTTQNVAIVGDVEASSQAQPTGTGHQLRSKTNGGRAS